MSLRNFVSLLQEDVAAAVELFRGLKTSLQIQKKAEFWITAKEIRVTDATCETISIYLIWARALELAERKPKLDFGEIAPQAETASSAV